MKLITEYRNFRDQDTSVSIEIIAGTSTFLGLAYIFVVNPVILSETGMPIGAAVFSSIVISGLATILMGIYTRLPFAVAPGLEMNGYFTFIICGVMGFSWQAGLSAVLLAGLICIALSFTSFHRILVYSMPSGLKKNIMISVGVFVAVTGFHIAGLFEMQRGIIQFKSLSIADFTTPQAILLYLGFVLTLVLSDRRLKIPGGFLIAIILTSIIAIGLEIDNKENISESRTLEQDLRDSFIVFSSIDWFAVFRSPALLMSSVILVFIQIYGGIGKYISLTASYGLHLQGDDKRIARAMRVDGLGTSMGAMLGTSSLITFVESSIGIAAGGRTGIVSIVCGILMFSSLFFRDLVTLIPIEATSGVLVFVLYLILRSSTESVDLKTIEFWIDFVIGVLMAIAGVITFSLEVPICLGFISYSIVSTWRERRLNWPLVGSSIVLASIIVFQRQLLT